jgi:hypothetical protein
MLAKSCVLCYVLTNGDGDDHGAHRADTARAHARWRYLVALHEATDPHTVFSRRHGCRNRRRIRYIVFHSRIESKLVFIL